LTQLKRLLTLKKKKKRKKTNPKPKKTTKKKKKKTAKARQTHNNERSVKNLFWLEMIVGVFPCAHTPSLRCVHEVFHLINNSCVEDPVKKFCCTEKLEDEGSH